MRIHFADQPQFKIRKTNFFLNVVPLVTAKHAGNSSLRHQLLEASYVPRTLIAQGSSHYAHGSLRWALHLWNLSCFGPGLCSFMCKTGPSSVCLCSNSFSCSWFSEMCFVVCYCLCLPFVTLPMLFLWIESLPRLQGWTCFLSPSSTQRPLRTSRF